MLFKLAGAALIISGSAAWGVSGAARLRARANILGALTSSIELMRGEVCDRLTPMPELMRTLADMSPMPVSGFYSAIGDGLDELGDMTFPELWRRGVEDAPELMLTGEEQRALIELGLSLGRYGAEEQRAAIGYAESRFGAFTARAEDERDKKSRLRTFMGVAAGLLAVIILL